MASLLQVCLALLLVSCVHGQAPSFLSQISQCTTGITLSALTNCSRDLITALGIQSTADLATLNNAICNNIQVVVTSNACTRTIYESCLSPEYHGLLQTDAGARDFYQYFCDHRSEMNVNCMNSAIPSDSCTLSAGTAYITAISQTFMVQATCNYTETVRGCLYNLGASCPAHNRAVYDTYYRKSYPPACTAGTTVGGQGAGYQTQVTGQCASGTISNQLSNCRTTFTSALGTSSSADVATTNNAICNNIPAVVNYNACSRGALEICLPAQYHGLLQTDAGVRDSYQYYCDHRSEININCMSTAISSDICTVNASIAFTADISQTGLVRATCSYMETARGCLFNLGPSCPNHNKDVYDTYFRKTYPPACAGGARSVPTSFLLLGACAVLFNKMTAAFLF